MTTANSSGSAHAAPSTLKPHVPAPTTPEDCVSPPPGSIDVANCCLLRAAATIQLIKSSGDDGEGFCLNHALIQDALWATAGWIDMAFAALNGKREAQS